MAITNDDHHLRQFHDADNNNGDISYNDTALVAAINYNQMKPHGWQQQTISPFLRARWQRHNNSLQ